MFTKMGTQVKEINQMLGIQLISEVRISQYERLTGNGLIEDFQDLMNMKPTKVRQVYVENFAKGICQIAELSFETVKECLSQPRKTDISKFMTEVIIPDPTLRNFIQERRKQIIVLLRKTGVVDQGDLRVFIKLYALFLGPMTVDSQVYNLKSSQENQKIKTMLMSLKKMMGNVQGQHVVMQRKQDTYSINLDVKMIILKASEMLDGTQAGRKLRQLIQISQNKKWLGPRMYKVVQQLDWEADSIRVFLDVLRKVNLEEDVYRSDAKVLRRVLKKIGTNLRKIIPKKKVSSPNKKSEEKNEVSRKVTAFEDYSDIFLPDLMEIEDAPSSSHSPFTSGRQLASDSDIEQFLVKKESGTIFDKLCYGEKN